MGQTPGHRQGMLLTKQPPPLRSWSRRWAWDCGVASLQRGVPHGPALPSVQKPPAPSLPLLGAAPTVWVADARPPRGARPGVGGRRGHRCALRSRLLHPHPHPQRPRGPLRPAPPHPQATSLQGPSSPRGQGVAHPSDLSFERRPLNLLPTARLSTKERAKLCVRTRRPLARAATFITAGALPACDHQRDKQKRPG